MSGGSHKHTEPISSQKTTQDLPQHSDPKTVTSKSGNETKTQITEQNRLRILENKPKNSKSESKERNLNIQVSNRRKMKPQFEMKYDEFRTPKGKPVNPNHLSDLESK